MTDLLQTDNAHMVDAWSTQAQRERKYEPIRAVVHGNYTQQEADDAYAMHERPVSNVEVWGPGITPYSRLVDDMITQIEYAQEFKATEPRIPNTTDGNDHAFGHVTNDCSSAPVVVERSQVPGLAPHVIRDSHLLIHAPTLP